jgi:hypothetical protein
MRKQNLSPEFTQWAPKEILYAGALNRLLFLIMEEEKE